MNLINDFKKWILDLLRPRIKGSYKKKHSLKNESFRFLFKKKKSSFIIGGFVFCLMTFGIGKSFTFITILIGCSPFVVIFWSSFGDQIMGMFKRKKN